MASKAFSRLSNLQRHLTVSSSSPSYTGRSYSSTLSIKLSDEVSDALSLGNAVVALESTIICHGMPYPQNLETAKQVEAIVRDNGATPATIAILDGVPCVGLNGEELEWLARLGTQVQKTARRDIAYVVAMRRNGATTVSATMFLASLAGISVFATGGTGGVHRHGEQTMDVSSDLTELGKTAVAVVSAGAKSILDIPRTLEYLETQGVCVAGYKTDEFPAFFTESSGCKVPCHVDSPEECARLIDASMKFKLGSGILIAVPIPKEHAASGSIVESAIQRALEEAKEKNISGSAETPFVLKRVNELTGGASLASSILVFFVLLSMEVLLFRCAILIVDQIDSVENVLLSLIIHTRYCPCEEQCNGCVQDCCMLSTTEKVIRGKFDQLLAQVFHMWGVGYSSLFAFILRSSIHRRIPNPLLKMGWPGPEIKVRISN